jgi:uncharacterized membrane protein
MMDFDPKAKSNNGAKGKHQGSLPRDSVKRSLVKAITWRIVGTLDTFVLSFLLITYLGPLLGLDLISQDTNIVQTAGYIALAEVFTKLIIYAGHEQIWTRVKWGGVRYCRTQAGKLHPFFGQNGNMARVSFA